MWGRLAFWTTWTRALSLSLTQGASVDPIVWVGVPLWLTPGAVLSSVE